MGWLALVLVGCGTAAGPGVDAGVDAGPMVTDLEGFLDAGRTLSGWVNVTGDAVVGAGVTLTLTAGTTVRVAPGRGLEVRGTLDVRGTKAEPVRFGGQPDAGLWAGLSLVTGTATLRNVAITDCVGAFTAAAGTQYDVQGLAVRDCDTALNVAGSGTIRYGTVHGRGAAHTRSPVVVAGATTLGDLLLDNVNTGVDMLVVAGGSPHLEHLEIRDAHCGIHISAGSNIQLTASSIHANAVGMMLNNALNTTVTGNNFFANGAHIGSCGMGSVVASGNFAIDLYDPSCAAQPPNQNPAAAALATAGPRPQP